MVLTELERQKYETVWADPRYRKYSPGERHYAEAIKAFPIGRGGSLIDYGCGTGRAARIFQLRGLTVVGVDFASNALEVDIPFRQACLWELPADLSADYSYCTDVMEHIPSEKVGAVLDGIAERTWRGAFFTIATRKDGFGPQILGEPLHLTVQSADWWREQLHQRFRTVDMNAKATMGIYVCRP